MKSLGIVRKLDHLGRVSIPKEIRDAKGWKHGQPVEMLATDEGIFIQEYQVDADKDNALTYLNDQLADATNADDIRAIKTAIMCLSSVKTEKTYI